MFPPNGFVVTPNSKLSDNTVDNFNNKYQSAYNLRNELIKAKIVVDGIFQSDYEFGSISSAASVVLGRSTSGQKEWVTENGLRFEEFVDQSDINDGTFNIDDENTYRYLKMGELAFKLFKNLFELGKISAEEVDKLKTKGYTKQLFNKSDYPILADNRYDNIGNSSHIRYRKDSLIFNGKEIYLTTQWFEDNRADLISWYQQHL